MTSVIQKKKFKICRRLGPGVYEKCQGQKFLLSSGKKAKTMGSKKMGRTTEYGLALFDKQRIRFAYGVSEKQFRGYINEVAESKAKGVSPSDMVFQIIESRLDNVIFRSGFAHTRTFARQLATHGHFMVNGKRSNIPSQRLKKGDVVTIRPGSKSKLVFEEIAKKLKATNAPSWLAVNDQELSVTIKGVPTGSDPFFNFQSVIEFYTKA